MEEKVKDIVAEVLQTNDDQTINNITNNKDNILTKLVQLLEKRNIYLWQG